MSHFVLIGSKVRLMNLSVCAVNYLETILVCQNRYLNLIIDVKAHTLTILFVFILLILF